MTAPRERYQTAIRSSNLASSRTAATTDADVLGAAGWAGRQASLALALLRLAAGDRHAVDAVAEMLAAKVVGRAWHAHRVQLPRPDAAEIAQAVLAWHLGGLCKHCGGHGLKKIAGTPTLGNEPCRPCRGTGEAPFDGQFSREQLPLAQWLRAEVEREEAAAGGRIRQRIEDNTT